MTDEKKKTEKKAEETTKEQKDQPIEKPQPKSEDKPEENISKERKIEEVVEKSEKVGEKSDTDIKDKPILEEPTKEVDIKQTDKKSKEIEPKIEPSEPVETSKVKEETKGKTQETKQHKESKKPPNKTEEQDEDFQYIVRIANTDIDGSKTVVMGIAQIKGIGRHMAVLIADATGIDKKLKMGKLNDAQIDKIREVLDDIENIAPGWMLNHRKDIDTGNDIHLISSDVDLRLRDDVNLLKMIRSYRGIRHETGLSVRGQRTRANNRRGLALGVSKKRPGA